MRVTAIHAVRYSENPFPLLSSPRTFIFRFSPSAVRKVAEEVVRSVLEDKVWNGEDEAVWTVTITEQVKQRVRGA